MVQLCYKKLLQLIKTIQLIKNHLVYSIVSVDWNWFFEILLLLSIHLVEADASVVVLSPEGRFWQVSL